MLDQPVVVAGEDLILLPEKAAYWPVQRTVFVSDVHLGKTETFQRRAIGLPSGSTQHDLKRLSALLARTNAQRLVILGDWLHAREARSASVHRQIQQWRETLGAVDMLLIPGNHDRHAGKIPPSWNIEVRHEPHIDTPFVYAHYPQESRAGYVLCGHLHPAYEFKGKGRQRIKQPCFWLRPGMLVFPAFGSFTGTARIYPSEQDAIYLTTSQAIVQIPRSR